LKYEEKEKEIILEDGNDRKRSRSKSTDKADDNKEAKHE
jgi:hypothetical protein